MGLSYRSIEQLQAPATYVFLNRASHPSDAWIAVQPNHRAASTFTLRSSMKTISREPMISVARRKNSAEGFVNPMSDEQQTRSCDSTGEFSISKLSKRLQKFVANQTECPFARSVSTVRRTSPSTGCIARHSRSKAFCSMPIAAQSSLKEVAPRAREGCNSLYLA